MSLPVDRDARNALPVWDGCVAYFPDCWAEIAKVSVLGNKQHALGEKLRFARDVSTDHANKVMRHMLDHAAGCTFDEDGTYHLAKAAWRALAALQVAIEANQQRIVRTKDAIERGPQHYGTVDAPKGPPLILNNKAEEPIRLRPGSIPPEGEVLYETHVMIAEEAYHGEANQQNAKSDPYRGVRTAGQALPDRGQEPRAQCAEQGKREWYERREGDGAVGSSPQVSGHWQER